MVSHPYTREREPDSPLWESPPRDDGEQWASKDASEVTLPWQHTQSGHSSKASSTTVARVEGIADVDAHGFEFGQPGLTSDLTCSSMSYIDDEDHQEYNDKWLQELCSSPAAAAVPDKGDAGGLTHVHTTAMSKQEFGSTLQGGGGRTHKASRQPAWHVPVKKELQTEVKTEHEPDTLQLCLSAGDSVGRRGRGGGGACMSTERRHTDSRYTARIYDHGAQYHVGSADGGRRGVKREYNDTVPTSPEALRSLHKARDNVMSLAQRSDQAAWSKEDEERLYVLVAETGEAGWKKKAEALGTGRTAKSVHSKYQRMTGKVKPRPRKAAKNLKCEEGMSAPPSKPTPLLLPSASAAPPAAPAGWHAAGLHWSTNTEAEAAQACMTEAGAVSHQAGAGAVSPLFASCMAVAKLAAHVEPPSNAIVLEFEPSSMLALQGMDELDASVPCHASWEQDSDTKATKMLPTPESLPSPKTPQKKWSKEELETFKNIIQTDGVGRWKEKAAKLSKLGTDRTMKAVHSKFMRENGLVKKRVSRASPPPMGSNDEPSVKADPDTAHAHVHGPARPKYTCPPPPRGAVAAKAGAGATWRQKKAVKAEPRLQIVDAARRVVPPQRAGAPLRPVATGAAGVQARGVVSGAPVVVHRTSTTSPRTASVAALGFPHAVPAGVPHSVPIGVGWGRESSLAAVVQTGHTATRQAGDRGLHSGLIRPGGPAPAPTPMAMAQAQAQLATKPKRRTACKNTEQPPKQWERAEFEALNKMLLRDGPGNWAQKAEQLTALSGCAGGRTAKSLHSKWTRARDPVTRLLPVGTHGPAAVTTVVPRAPMGQLRTTIAIA